jgi:hypothetical protein
MEDRELAKFLTALVVLQWKLIVGEYDYVGLNLAPGNEPTGELVDTMIGGAERSWERL